MVGTAYKVLVDFYYISKLLQNIFLQNGPYNIKILVMFFKLRAFLKFDQYGWFKKMNLVFNL